MSLVSFINVFAQDLNLGGEYGDEEYAYLFTSAGWTCYNTRSWDDNYMKEEEIPAGSIGE